MNKLISGIMAVTMATCMFAACGSSGNKDDSKPYEKVIVDFENSINDRDADTLFKCVFPDEVFDQFKTLIEGLGADWEEIKEDMMGNYDGGISDLGKVSVEIKSSKKADDISIVQDYVDEMYESMGVDGDHEVSEAYEVDTVIKAENEDDKEETLYSYKLNGDWYIMTE